MDSTTTDIFAPYQPLHGRQYDLSNTYDRTCIAGVIATYLDKCERCIDLYGEHEEVLADLHRHQHALETLNEFGDY